ncbi:hypothetical protein RDABS01_039712 [Bienertia sinuspersici]
MRLKRCTTTTTILQEDNCNIDRLTSLPLELLICILSFLPTKDAAVACLSSKRMITHVFHSLTCLDFDDSPICHCNTKPYAIKRFPTFVAFVDSVLLSYQSRYLTSFRLGVGPRFLSRYCHVSKHQYDDFQPMEEQCKKGCYPELKSMHINTWISFPLTFCGLMEIDLRVHVREEGDIQLPPEIFTCETLEVLKLDTNLGLHQASTLPSFRLPKLKLLSFHAAMIPDDDLVTRLVSSCPLLEDLTVVATWVHARFISISSPSVRRLYLEVWNIYEENYKTDFVLIHAPNLEYLHYNDNLASHYIITKMDCLIEANLEIEANDLEIEYEVSGQQKLSLLRPLSNVQHLIMIDRFLEELNHEAVKDQLPVFHNLKRVELGYDEGRCWDKILLAFLNHSPALETIVFPQGLTSSPHDYRVDEEDFASEQQFCRTVLANVPTCCKDHLKEIVVKDFNGYEREIDLIQFLLRHALVLEKLVMYPCCWANVDRMRVVECTLQNLPKASVTCSIQLVYMF